MITDKNLHWFDLDGTLWQSGAMWWLLDKKNPAKYVMRITQHQAVLIQSGFYKKDGVQILYNGMEGWLPQELFQKLVRIKPLKPEEIGISFREFDNFEMINAQAKNLIVHIDRISHLKDSNDVINLLTARGNKEAHTGVLNKLSEELNKVGLKVNQANFVNDHGKCKFTGTTSVRKALHIIESIVGYEIKDNSFIPLEVDRYKKVFFYDDEDKNIDECKSVNTLISGILANTDEWLRNEIIESINSSEQILYINIVNTNVLNPFETTEIKIKV
jgi:hypothetical protein